VERSEIISGIPIKEKEKMKKSNHGRNSEIINTTPNPNEIFLFLDKVNIKYCFEFTPIYVIYLLVFLAISAVAFIISDKNLLNKMIKKAATGKNKTSTIPPPMPPI